MASGADFILAALVAEGLHHVFMVPGGLIDPFLPALGRQTALTPIVAAQEGGAAYMADGYARASGKFGAALVIGGPGLANTTTAVATAQTDGSPLLILSGEVSTFNEGLGGFQDASAQTLDDVSLMKPITRYSSSIDNPKALPRLLKRAILQLRSAPAGPAHLSLPRDCLIGEIEVAHHASDALFFEPHALSLALAEKSLARFHATVDGPPVKIVILVGAGVEHAGAAQMMRAFAERWHIPVATTLRAKGIFPEDHPSLGVFGYAGTHHARLAISDAPPDLKIVLGSGLNERDTMHWTLKLAPRSTICVDLSPVNIGTHADGAGVVGDCGAYLAYLLANSAVLAPALEAGLEARKAWVDAIHATPRLQDAEHMTSDASPIHPARVIMELRKAFPRDGVLLVDSGAHRAFAGHYWECYELRTYVSATNLGPMGWAVPAAIGVQCARPDRRVAVVTGDGCMRMHGIEVATAARYRLPIIYVVINNAALGNVWLRAHGLGPAPDELTRLPDHDWAGFARALGCRSETVRASQELAGAFSRALEGEGPCLVDVKAGMDYATPVRDWADAIAAYSFHE